MEYLTYMFFNNSLLQWAVALLVAIVTFGGLYVLRRVILAQLRRLGRRTDTNLDDVIAEAVSATRNWFLVLVAIWAGTLVLVLPELMRFRFARLITLITLFQIGLWIAAAIRGYIARLTEKRLENDPSSVTTVRALGYLGIVVVWVAVVLVALDNVGIQVTAMVAGLGIGGVAIALAVQNILGDLFASLSIVLDKPFVYGDFVIVDDMLGTVEKIGIKTTRIRSLSGEQIVFSNSDLLNSRVRNYKRMFERRVVFTVGVVHQTPREQVAAIPTMIKEAVESHRDLRFDRAHFFRFGESAYDYEVVYYVLDPSYNVYMDRQQAINLHIVDYFAEHGIRVAYPTRTLHVQSPQGAV